MKKNQRSKLKIFVRSLYIYTPLFLLDLILYLLSENNVINIKLGILDLSYLFLIGLIAIPAIWLIRLLININKFSKKDAVKAVDTTKIKDFGEAKWLHNDLNDNNKTLQVLHMDFNCSCDKCIGAKKVNKKPGWVVSTQFRSKMKNSLLLPPITSQYEEFDDNLGSTVLNKQRFEIANKNYEKELTTVNSKYNLVCHSVSDMHTIVLGATGSGKTQKMIFPGIWYNAQLDYDRRPTLVITDPKGEIHASISGFLKQQGYDIKVLNYRDSLLSHSFNPLYISWKYRYDAIFYRENKIVTKTFENLNSVIIFIENGEINLNNEVTKVRCEAHMSRQCKECSNIVKEYYEKMQYEDGEAIHIYVREGIYYFDEERFEQIVSETINKLKAKSEKEIVSFANIVIQNSGSGDQFWSDGARSYFIGIATTMLEMMDKNPSIMPIEKFNMPSIVKMMNSSNVKEWYEKYRQKKMEDIEDSFAYDQVASTANAAENTQQSLISSAKVATKDYSYTDIQGMLCNTKNMLNLEEIARGEVPSAVFLIVPDDDKSMHPLAATFVDQFYKTSVKIAMENQEVGRCENATLTRQIQFYLDEFGNFPKIPTFPEMITVSRSRNIFFMLILQDYDQLKKYGDDAETIKSNCNLSVYIKTNSDDTAKTLEKEYGDKAILNFGANDNSARTKQNDTKEKEKTEQSASIQSVPLISSNNLLKLDPNLLIVKKVSKDPALLHAQFSYRIPQINNLKNITKVNAPTNSINFMKDHYFNIFEKDYTEWLNFISDEDNSAIMDYLDSIEIDSSVFDDSPVDDLLETELQERIKEQSKKKKQHQLHEENNITKKDLLNNDISDYIETNNDLNINNSNQKTLDYLKNLNTNVFLTNKQLAEKLQDRINKIKLINDQYNELTKNGLSNNMSLETKDKINELYITRKKMLQENEALMKLIKSKEIDINYL